MKTVKFYQDHYYGQVGDVYFTTNSYSSPFVRDELIHQEIKKASPVLREDVPNRMKSLLLSDYSNEMAKINSPIVLFTNPSE